MILADASVANTSYLWVEIAAAILALSGVGGLAAVIKSVRQGAVRDAKLDELIDPNTGVMARFAAIDKAIKPNGKDTQQVGDIVARTEDKIDRLASKVDQHIGAEKQAHGDMWAAIHSKQDREAA